jgi:hypothetical protein
LPIELFKGVPFYYCLSGGAGFAVICALEKNLLKFAQYAKPNKVDLKGLFKTIDLATISQAKD